MSAWPWACRPATMPVVAAQQPSFATAADVFAPDPPGLLGVQCSTTVSLSVSTRSTSNIWSRLCAVTDTWLVLRSIFREPRREREHRGARLRCSGCASASGRLGVDR